MILHCFILEEHAYQQFIGCAFNNEGQVSRFWRYGYDGRDIMHVDLTKEAVVATSEPGQLLAEERKSKEYIKRKEARLVKVCSAVKTVFLKSNNSLSRAGKPAVCVYHCNLDAFDAHTHIYIYITYILYLFGFTLKI